ncbi:19528_t:CDS:10 [Entrophospora sp. SA101]|nr:19337_t:CDS:10 [Entrophospora sp. SA101]CAJ0755376.1 19528_t:CDS:10 [Entrophospora sp. SA101]CAJ0840567.1 17101_t:CDS:10 [Entrophospora sp. SA101]
MSFDRSKSLQSTVDDDDLDLELQERSDNIKQRESNWMFHTVSILKLNKTNALLIFFIPAVVLKALNVDETITFFFNFLAIIPLSNILTIGVGDLAARFGPAYGAVFHAFSGSFVELVIESYALMDEQYAIVRSWPTERRRREGSMNSLNVSIQVKLFVNTSASILALAVLALVTPAAFKIAAAPNNASVSPFIECNIRNISHATAIILTLIYIGLLVFQLKTHAQEVIDAKEFDTEVKYNWFFDLILVAVSIAGITVCARFLVTSIEHTAQNFELGTGFVGIVLFPLCAIHDAVHDKVDTAISLILNTSVQMALLVAPILVLVGWILDKPLTLDFNALEIAVLSCAVLIVNYLVADNKANWLEDRSYYCDPFSRNLPPKNVTDSILQDPSEGGGGGEVTNTCIPASINDLTARLTVLDQWRIGHGILVLLLLRKSRTFGNGTTYYILTIASFSTSLTSLQNLDSDMRCNLEPQSLQLKYPESDFVSFKIYKTFAIETFGYLSKQSFNYVKLV